MEREPGSYRKTISVQEPALSLADAAVNFQRLPCDPFIQLLLEPGLVMGKTDDYLIILPADAHLCLVQDLIMVVAQVMQFVESRIFFPLMGRIPLIR